MRLRRAKRTGTGLGLSALLVVLLVALTGGTALADGAAHAEFSGSLDVVNPCSSEAVVVNGPVKVVYHAAAQNTVQITFRGTGTGLQGNTYRVSLVGTEQFATASGTFAVPFQAQVITNGAAPNFAFEGIVTVVVENGQPVRAHITEITNSTCRG